MKQAYVPALEVSANTLIERVRELPLAGKAEVSIGDRVSAQTKVLSAELPGDLSVIRVAERMGFEPDDVADKLQIEEGDEITKGQLICELKTFFGLFTSQLTSPMSGVVEFYTSRNAHLGIRQAPKPISIDAYISGEVTKIEEGKRVFIETRGALIQGVFGVGGERQGRVEVLEVGNDEIVSKNRIESLSVDFSNAILVGGSQFSLDALEYVSSKGALGVITGSIDAQVLRDYVGHEIGVSITGDEDVPSTLIVTEGFGKLPISERVVSLAKQLSGKYGSINGATQVRAGATRPELIVTEEGDNLGEVSTSQKTLEVGAAVRVIRVPYFGCFGEVVELPTELCEIESGAHVRVLKAKLSDGREVVVPRANVELL